MVEEVTRLPSLVDESALVKVTIESLENRQTTSHLLDRDALRDRELKRSGELGNDLRHARLDQTMGVNAVLARRSCCSGGRGRAFLGSRFGSLEGVCPPATTLPLTAIPRLGHRTNVEFWLFPVETTTAIESSGNKFLEPQSRFGLNKRLNRRFRKQDGGLLIRGSQVRILPGAFLSQPRIRRNCPQIGCFWETTVFDRVRPHLPAFGLLAGRFRAAVCELVPCRTRTNSPSHASTPRRSHLPQALPRQPLARCRVAVVGWLYYMTSTIGKRGSASRQAAAKRAVPTSPLKSE